MIVIPSTTSTASPKAQLPCTSPAEFPEQREATPLRSPPMVIDDDDDDDNYDDDNKQCYVKKGGGT